MVVGGAGGGQTVPLSRKQSSATAGGSGMPVSPLARDTLSSSTVGASTTPTTARSQSIGGTQATGMFDDLFAVLSDIYKHGNKL